MKRYQILKREGREPWQFIAHGAVYVDDEGEDIEAIIKRNGGKTKRIAV